MPLLILILLLVGGTFLFIKIRKSKWVETLTNDILTEPDDHDPETNKVIDDISVAEQGLKDSAEADTKEAERLQEKASNVGEFLASRGVVKPDKGEGGS